MSGLAHICHQLEYNRHEVAALAWINDMPILKHSLEFITSNFVILSKCEVSLLEQAPVGLRDLSEEALDQKIAILEEELSGFQQQHGKLENSIQSAVPYLQELANDLSQVKAPEKLPDLTIEVENLQMALKQNVVSILNMPKDLRAQLDALRQFFNEEVKEECNPQVLETFIEKEDWFIKVISATAKEIEENVKSIQSSIEQYSAECSAAISCHRESVSTVMHRRLAYLLSTSRLQKLTEVLPLYAAGKYLPQFPTALREFLNVHKEYKDLLASCSKLVTTVICCPEALSQQLVAEALLQRCTDVKGQAFDILLETVSDAMSRGQRGVDRADDKNRIISAVIKESSELLGSLSSLQSNHISPMVTAMKLVAKAKEEFVLSPISTLGYQAVVSALSGSAVRGAAQVADTLLLVSQPGQSDWKNNAADLSDALNLQDKFISAIGDGSDGSAQSVILARLQQAIQKTQQSLEHYSNMLEPQL
ncbi:Hypothetical protein GLP15_3946 [Giardia lamblia P15]|uniref:Uncharacterized protein n=1 Tax=Giardia intestinalis (strain P15) TaxID=658858 RepID=E1F2H7_GIAIA|nr:Hypothetical protein GLP15_3946 [Giardia lamblia P15]